MAVGVRQEVGQVLMEQAARLRVQQDHVHVDHGPGGVVLLVRRSIFPKLLAALTAKKENSKMGFIYKYRI